LCAAAKDISNAGVIGTALMLLECSGIGAEIDLAKIPRPPGVALERWLNTFPSYGFIMSVADKHIDILMTLFLDRGLACGVIGRTDASRRVYLRHGAEGNNALLWDFADEALIGCAPSTREAGYA